MNTHTDWVWLSNQPYRLVPLRYRVYASIIDYTIVPTVPWAVGAMLYLFRYGNPQVYQWLIAGGMMASFIYRGVTSTEPAATLGQRLFGIRMVPQHYPSSSLHLMAVMFLREPVKMLPAVMYLLAAGMWQMDNLPFTVLYAALGFLLFPVVPALTDFRLLFHNLILHTQCIVERTPHPRAYELLNRWVAVAILLWFTILFSLAVAGFPRFY